VVVNDGAKVLKILLKKYLQFIKYANFHFVGLFAIIFHRNKQKSALRKIAEKSRNFALVNF
jgi:hypothetical protein